MDHVVIEWPPIQGETRWKEKFHLYAMMAINHLMDGIKMQPECITPTLWQNVQTLVRATKYHLKGVPWVKASQLYVCIEHGFFAICSLYNTKVDLLTRLGPTEWTVNVTQDDVCLSGRQKLQNIIYKGFLAVKASQLYVCIESQLVAICSLYNTYQRWPTNTLRALWMDDQFWTESLSF